MGNCFSRGKGRSPVSAIGKEKEEYVVNLDSDESPVLNGNTNLMGSSILATSTAPSANSSALSSVVNTLTRERSCRSFYRIPSVISKSSNSDTGNGRVGKNISDIKINNLFDYYRDNNTINNTTNGNNEDIISAEGIERLCNDLGVVPEDFKILIFAWKLDASQMCRFTRDEFVNGCRAMCVDNIKGIQNKLPEIVQQVAVNPDVFKDLYRFTFRFGLDQTVAQRILPIDMAIVLWKLVFNVREPPILKPWLLFLEKHSHVRGIPRDTWNMLLNFSESVGDDLSSYDDTEAWPSIFDDFVEYENDQTNQNIICDKKEINM